MRKAIILGAVLSITLAGFAAAQAPAPLATPPDELARWGVRCYELIDPNLRTRRTVSAGNPKVHVFGYDRLALVLTSTVVTDQQVVMYDIWPMRPPLREVHEKVDTAKNGDLSLESILLRSRGRNADAAAEGGELVVRENGQERRVALAANTVCLASLMRIVELLPKEEGRDFAARPYLDTNEMALWSDSHPIRCEGETNIALYGSPYACTRFTYGDLAFYVRNDDSKLVRVDLANNLRLLLYKEGYCCPGDDLHQILRQAGIPVR